MVSEGWEGVFRRFASFFARYSCQGRACAPEGLGLDIHMKVRSGKGWWGSLSFPPPTLPRGERGVQGQRPAGGTGAAPLIFIHFIPL